MMVFIYSKSERTFQIDQMPRRCRPNLLARHACISMPSQSFESDPPFNKPVLVPPLYFRLSILVELHARTEPHI